jgi:hypothetical protein
VDQYVLKDIACAVQLFIEKTNHQQLIKDNNHLHNNEEGE